MKGAMAKKVEVLEHLINTARNPKCIQVAFAPFPGICDKYSLTVPETGKRMEFDTEAAMLNWLTERQLQHILVSTVDGRHAGPKEKSGGGILLTSPPMTEEQWEVAVRPKDQ